MNVVTRLEIIKKNTRLAKDILNHDIYKYESKTHEEILKSNSIEFDYSIKLKDKLKDFTWYNFNDYKLVKSTLTQLEEITNELLQRKALMFDRVQFRGLEYER